MAPLVSPFCSPLSSTSLERAGVPAGKQSRPIMAQPYPRWTNRGCARRAKMNGSLSPSVLLSLRSSLSAILRALFLHLDFRHLSLTLVRVYPACSVRWSVRLPPASAVVLGHVALYLATFQRLTRYFLSFSGLFHLSLFSFLSFFLSFFLSLSAIFSSHSYVLPPSCSL